MSIAPRVVDRAGQRRMLGLRLTLRLAVTPWQFRPLMTLLDTVVLLTGLAEAAAHVSETAGAALDRDVDQALEGVVQQVEERVVLVLGLDEHRTLVSLRLLVVVSGGLTTARKQQGEPCEENTNDTCFHGVKSVA